MKRIDQPPQQPSPPHDPRDCRLCGTLRHPAQARQRIALQAHLAEKPFPRQQVNA